MKPTKFGLGYHKLNAFYKRFRTYLLKQRGLKVGVGSKIGKITCDWPNKLSFGNGCDIQDHVDFKIWHPFDESTFIKVGNRVFIGHSCEFVSNSNITIGDDCLIASRTTFVDVGHSYNRSAPMNTQKTISKEIRIGEDVWIGTSSIILGGVSIGKGSIIGAGSLVNKSIPEYQIWAGSPAKFIKNRD